MSIIRVRNETEAAKGPSLWKRMLPSAPVTERRGVEEGNGPGLSGEQRTTNAGSLNQAGSGIIAVYPLLVGSGLFGPTEGII